MTEIPFAYIGPGAGFTIAGAAWPVIAAFFSALLMLLTWPIRLLWRALFGGGARAPGSSGSSCWDWTAWTTR